jgi:hypothetical protein
VLLLDDISGDEPALLVHNCSTREDGPIASRRAPTGAAVTE